MIPEHEKPSNFAFGVVFFFVSSLGSLYSFHVAYPHLAMALGTTSLLFAFLTLTRSNVLFVLKRIWMSFGDALSKLTNPIILGILFFLLFTPTAIWGKVSGRDELALKAKNRPSKWKVREEQMGKKCFFPRQF